ncbi:MAG TPA: ABC transporter permease [Vineibacter sp.]|nr:ABC transporter permease [Vineibacter sp.]
MPALILKKPKAVAGASLVGLMLVLALLAPWIAPYDPLALDPVVSNQAPSAQFWLGTDFFGRDVLSRMIWGARPSLLIGFASVAVGCLIGSAIGLMAGYFRGWVDAVLMRPVDVLLSFPIVVLALALVAALGPSLFNLIITISLLFVPRFARVVRAEAMALRELDYIEAARVAGQTPGVIIVKHVLPNALAQIIVTCTVFMANAILVEAGLSFLGVGVTPPEPSWGNMLAEGRNNILGAPWLTTFPGVMLTLTLIGFNLLGDALRDILDPRLRGLHS